MCDCLCAMCCICARFIFLIFLFLFVRCVCLLGPCVRFVFSSAQNAIYYSADSIDRKSVGMRSSTECASGSEQYSQLFWDCVSFLLPNCCCCRPSAFNIISLGFDWLISAFLCYLLLDVDFVIQSLVSAIPFLSLFPQPFSLAVHDAALFLSRSRAPTLSLLLSRIRIRKWGAKYAQARTHDSRQWQPQNFNKFSSATNRNCVFFFVHLGRAQLQEFQQNLN